MTLVNYCLDLLKDIYSFIQTSINDFNGLTEITQYLVGLPYRFGYFSVDFYNQYSRPGVERGLDIYYKYDEAYDVGMEDRMEELFIFCWDVKTTFAELTSQYFFSFTVDDFRFFKHHGDDPGAVRTQGGYEDLAGYFENFIFDFTNFILYHVLPTFFSFFYDYYIKTEHLTYGVVFVVGIICCGLIYDYIKTLVEVQRHLHRLDSMQLIAITEYLRKHKVIYKNKKIQDSYEDRQYNAGGYDRELFIDTLIHTKNLKDKLRKAVQPFEDGYNANNAKFGVDLRGKNPNKVEESEIFGKDSNEKPEINIDKTIDPLPTGHRTEGEQIKRTRHLTEFFRKGVLADAVHMFELMDTKEMRFWYFISNLYDLPRNLYKLTTLLFGGLKTLLASSGPTHGTHFDVDFKIYLDLFTVHELEDTGRVVFNKMVLNYIYDAYVSYFKDITIDVNPLLNRYIDFKLRNDGHYYKSGVRLAMKDETFFFFGLRLNMVLDLLECEYPSIFYIRNLDIMFFNLIRYPVLYCLRIYGRFLKMPLFEKLDEYLVKYQIKRITSPLEEASCFGFIPMYAQADVIGYIKYLDDNNISHWFHVSYYKGGKKKSFNDGLKDFFFQFLQLELFNPRNLFILEPFGINKYDNAFRYTIRGSFETYLTARIYMRFIMAVRYYIFRPINISIKNFFRQTGTGEMYMFITFLRIGYETPIYRCYKFFFDYFFYGEGGLLFRNELLPAEVKANSKYTRKLALETVANKNKNGGLFYFPYLNYHTDFMQEDLYYGFDEEDEEPYTHEEAWLEIDYKEDHDTLLESDFQLRKNGKRDMFAGYALINEELGVGLKGDRTYDFYTNSEELGGHNTKKWSIYLTWVPYIQNTRKPVREIYQRQKESFMPGREHNPYGGDKLGIKNGSKIDSYDRDIAIMEKEALYLLYYRVNSPLNGFFTNSFEVDDGFYYSYNTILKDADEYLNEEEYIIYQYKTSYAYGPFGTYFDELPTLLYYPEWQFMRKALRKGHISKKGRRLGKWSYNKSLRMPLFFSSIALNQNMGTAYNQFENYLNETDQDKTNQDKTDQDKADQDKVDQESGVNLKVRKRFENFLLENKELQSEFNELMLKSYNEKQMSDLKFIEQLYIGTEIYPKELKLLQHRKEYLHKYFGDFLKKLKDE